MEEMNKIVFELNSLISQTQVIQRDLEGNTLDVIQEIKKSIQNGKNLLCVLEEKMIKAVEERNERLFTILEDCVLTPLQSLVREFSHSFQIFDSEEKEKKKEKLVAEEPRRKKIQTLNWMRCSQDVIDWCCNKN